MKCALRENVIFLYLYCLIAVAHPKNDLLLVLFFWSFHKQSFYLFKYMFNIHENFNDINHPNYIKKKKDNVLKKIIIYNTFKKSSDNNK